MKSSKLFSAILLISMLIAPPQTLVQAKPRVSRVSYHRKVTKKVTKKKIQTKHNKKSTSPKRTTFPKILQGKWYFGRYYHLTITKNSITGSQFGYRRNLRLYQGNKSYLHYFAYKGHQVYFWKQGRYYYLTLVDNYPAKLWLTKKHGRRNLKVLAGAGHWANYYRSRWAARHYGNK